MPALIRPRPEQYRAAPRCPQGPAAAERASLLELFLSGDDGAAIRGALEWLGAAGLARQAACVLVSENGRLLLGERGHHVSRSALSSLSVDLDERDHPLVKALWGVGPTLFAIGGRQPPLPVPEPLWALPLRTGPSAGGAPIGLLLVSASGPQPQPQLLWLARELGQRLGLGRSLKSTADERAVRDLGLLRAGMDAVPDPVLLTDREGRLLVANPRAEKLLLSGEGESEPRRRAVALNKVLLSVALANREVDPREPSRDELMLVDPGDGSELLFELISSPVEVGGSWAIVSVLRNVTDLGQATQEMGESVRQLRQAQDEVAAERHQLELILDSVADPIVVTDAAGEVVLMNPPAVRMFTLPQGASQAVRRQVRANAAHFSSFLSNLILMGEQMKWRGELELVEPASGEPLPMEASSGKILSPRGELSTVVTILHDRRETLEKARLNEELRAAKADLEKKVQLATAELAHQNELLRRQAVALEQASSAKSGFLANISHEFRTPLNAILGYTSMLLQGVSGALSPGQRKNLLRVDSNGRHLLQVINEILDITRIEAGRMPLHRSSFRLPELLREVTAELEPIMSQSPVPVSVEVSGELGPLRSDRQKVKQIVVNLLSNALKFTHQGSIHILVRQERRAGKVAISVRDTGIGIAPEHHAQIFEDFKQVDNSPTRPYSGTGLGLAICRRLAGMLQGKISLESAPGRGSTFTLFLPRRLKR